MRPQTISASPAHAARHRRPLEELVEPYLPTVHLAREVPPPVVQAQLASGLWTRVRRGAYVATSSLVADTASPAPSRSGPAGRGTATTPSIARIAAVARQISPTATFSHDSAALLWGLPSWREPSRVHVIHRSARSGHAARDVVRHADALEGVEVLVRSGLRVTSLERTVVDCARSSRAASALVLADAAVRHGADRDVMAAALRTLDGARGVRLARAVLDLADGGAESPWESVTRLVLVGTGLPAPSTQVPIMTRLGLVFADMGWEGWRVAIEFDGLVKYTSLAVGDPGGVIFAEKRRHDAIVEAGWHVVRVTRGDLRPPESLRDRVLALVEPGTRGTLRPAPHLLLGM